MTIFRKCTISSSKSSNVASKYAFRIVENIPLQHIVGPTEGINNLSLNLISGQSPRLNFLKSFLSNTKPRRRGKVGSPFEIYLKFGTIWESTAQIYYTYGSVYDELDVLHKQTIRLPEDQIIKMEWFTLRIPEAVQDDPDASTELTLILILQSKFLSFYNDDGIKCITKFSLLDDFDLAPGILMKCFTSVDKHLYGASESGDIFIFDYDPNRQKMEILLKYGGLEVSGILSIASNANRIVCACSNGILVYWKVERINARTKTNCIPPSQGALEKVYFWDKETIVVTTNSGFVLIYNIENNDLLQSVQIQAQPSVSIISSDFLAKSKIALLLIILSNGTVEVWKLTSKTKRQSSFLCFNSQQNPIFLFGTLILSNKAKGPPVGARFLNSSGKLVGVTAVGEKCLNIYRHRKN